MSSTARKATNISLDANLLTEARSLDINLSRAAEDGLRHAVAKARRDQWLAENSAAIESSNRYVEQHGLPLARYRMF